MVIRITNDTTTLNGALSQLGETMAANITTKGVSASASDGLTTLAGKILQISGDTPTPSTVIFDEDGSVDHSSTLFGSYISLRNSGTATATYNNNGYYVLTNTSADAEAFIPFPALEGITSSFKMTTDSQSTGTGVCGIALYYYIDANNWGGVKEEGQGMWISAKTNGTFTEANKYNNSTYKNLRIKNEFIYDANANTLTINRYDKDNPSTIFQTFTMNIPVTITSSVKWGTSTTWANNANRNLYEIKAEYIGGDTPCSEYIAEIDSAIEYINGSGN